MFCGRVRQSRSILSYDTEQESIYPWGKTVKVYCWPCQLKANCFWWSLWRGSPPKKAFARSTAAYHGLRIPHLVQMLQIGSHYLIKLSIVMLHDPCVFCTGHIGKLKGDLVGTTIPASFKSLRMALIFSIPPGMWNCLWFIIFPSGDNSNGLQP